MSLKIELLDHPGKRHVQVSKSDRRHVFLCPACNEKQVEQAGRPPGRKVRCDSCKGACVPYMVPALPEQHGIYLSGKCVAYCTKESDPEIWWVEKVDPSLMAEVTEVVQAKYGGEALVHEKPEWPDETEEAPPDDDDIEEDEGE